MPATERATRSTLHQIPARVAPADHLSMSRLAAARGRGVGEEYREAISAWLARPSNAAALAPAESAKAA